MSETFEFDGMYRGMGDIVDDDGVGESLYHYAEAPAPQPRPQPRQRRAANANANAQQADMSGEGDDLSDDPTPPATRPAQPAPSAVAVAPQRGLKTPMILGLSAGALAAAGVYGYLRWKRPDEEAPVKLAGVAGGVSGLGVLITILAARGAGMLDRGQAKV